MPPTNLVEESDPYLTIRGGSVSEEADPYLTIRGDKPKEADPYLTVGTTQTARREPPELRAATPMTSEDLALGEARRDVRKKGEEAAYEESTRKNLRDQGFPEPMISALLMPGGESLDRAISLAAPIAGGVAGTAAIPIAGPTAPYIGGGGAAALANTWAQLREHARSGATTPIDFKKGRFLGEVFMGAVIPAPARTLAPGMRAAQVIETGATLGGQMGAIGAGESALRQLGDEGTIDFRELAKDTTRGALTGVALGTTFSTASQIYKNLKLKNAKGIEGYSPSEIGTQIALRGGGGVGGFAYGWSSNPELPFDKRLENALLWASASGGLAPTVIFKAIKKVRGSGPAKTKVFADWQDAMNREYGPGTVPEVSDKLAYPEWKAAMTQRHGDNPYLDEVWDIIQLRKSEAEARTPAGKAKLAEEAAIANKAKLAEEQALAAEKAAAAEALAARQARAEEALAAQQAAGTETPGVPRRPIIDESQADLARRKINEDFGNNAGESAAVFEAAARAADEQAAARAADELAAARAAEELAATTARNLEPAANIARTIEGGLPVKSAEESAEVMGAAEARETARLAREAALDAGGFTAAKERARIEAQRNEELTPRAQLGLQGAAASAAILDEANADPDESELRRNLRLMALGAVVPSLASKAPTFYSRLTRTVEQFPQSRASGAQWKGTIRNSKLGVNQDEFALAKVDDLQGDKIYPKAEVLEYLRANEVVVKDVTLGDRGSGMEIRPTGGEFEVYDQNNLRVFFGNRTEVDSFVRQANREYDTTYFSDYQLPGAKEGSYREVLLTVPEPPKVFRSREMTFGDVPTGATTEQLFALRARALAGEKAKYAEAVKTWRDGHSQYSQHPNPIVRLRYNERTTADGKRMLFLEEVQAPQKGEFAKMPELFQKNWREIAFKWAMRKASDEGFDSVGWTTGEQQAARYDLSKQVDAVRVTKNPDGTYGVEVRPPGNRGFRVVEAKTSADQLGNFIGKDLAGKSIADTSGEKFIATYDGLDLKVGGEGLKKLYDSDFRNVVNNLSVVKKSGQKVGTSEIVTQEQKMVESPINVGEPTFEQSQLTTPVHSIPITPAIRESAMQGQPMFSVAAGAAAVLDEANADPNESELRRNLRRAVMGMAVPAFAKKAFPNRGAVVPKTPEEFLRASVGDPAGNLRMKLGKRPGTGTAKNALVEFEDLQGRPIAVGADKAFGGKPFGVWASETEKWLNDADISTFRNWYKELNQKFVSEFGEERAPTMMMAWLAAQQNVSPGGALGNVFKVEDRLAGIGVGKKGGLADKKIEGVLTQQVQSKGFGAKLTDFVDAGFMRRVRSYMGGDARGGEPFVADVHTGRDSGHVDHQTLSRLKDKADEGNLFIAGNPVTIKVTKTKTLQQGKEISQVPTRVWVTAEGMKPFGLNIDQTSSPSGPRYEGISEWGNALTRDLNEKQWKGGNWTPSEVQAVGWMRILRQYGLPEESVATALAKNTGRVYAEVNYSLGAALRNTLPSFGQLPYDTQQAITKEVLEQAVPMIADRVGGSLRVRSISMGDGMFGGPKAPSAAVEVMGSTEAIDLFTVALAHVSEQAATMSVTFGLGGKNSRSVRFKKVDGSKFTGDEITSLIDDAKLGGFSVHQLPGGTEALITDAGKNFKPKAFSEKKAQRVSDQITTWADVRKVDIDIDIPTTRVTAYENDWSSHPKGQTYLEILNRRGIGSKVSDLDGLRGEYRTLLEQSFDRYAPGVRQERGPVSQTSAGLGSSPTTGGFSPKSTAGFSQYQLMAHLGGGAGGFAAGWSANSELPPDKRLEKALMWAAAAGGLGPAALFKAVKLAKGSGPAKIPRAKLDPKTASLDDLRNIFIHEAEQSPSLLARFSRATELLQDRHQPLTDVEEAILGSRPQGLTLGDRASLIGGAAGKAEAALTPLIELRKKISSEVDDLDVSTFLFLRRTMDRLETNKRNAATYAYQQANHVFGPPPVAPTPRDVGTFTEAIVRQKMGLLQAKLGNNNLLALDALGAEFQKLSDSNLQTLVNAGRLSKADRATIKADNDFYAPFKVMKYMSAVEGVKGTGRAIDTSVSVIKAIKGIKDEDIQLGDIMLAMGENTLRTHVLAEKNRVMLALAALADADPTGKYIQRVAPHKSPPSGFVGVNYMKDGSKLELAVLEPVARAVKGLNEQQLGVVGQALKNSAAVFRLGTVGANIGFQLVNSVKDQKRLAELSKYGFTSMADLYRYPMDFAQAAISSWGSNILGKKNQLYLDFMKSGSAGSTIAETLAPSAFRSQASVFNPISYGIEWSARIGKGIEETTKIMGYKRGARLEGLEKLTGADRQKALDRIAYEVRNYAGSPDFNKHGTLGVQMNILFMFANARMQGTAADMRRLSGRTGGREAVSAMSRLAVGTGLPTLALWYYNQQGDNLTDYESLSKREKTNNWMIPQYGADGKPLYFINEEGYRKREYIKLPKTDILAQVALITEGVLNFAKDQDPKAAMEAGQQFLENMSPINISGRNNRERVESIISGLNPILKTPLEFSTGRDTFRHQPIVPRRLENAPANLQFKDSTHEIFKDVANQMSPDASPLQLQRAVENMTGGLATQFMRPEQPGRSLLVSSPFFGRFFGSPAESKEKEWEIVNQWSTKATGESVVRDNAIRAIVNNMGKQPEAQTGRDLFTLIERDPKSIPSIISALKDKSAGTTAIDKALKSLPSKDRAGAMVDMLGTFKTSEEKSEYLESMVRRGVITKDVLVEMRSLMKKP